MTGTYKHRDIWLAWHLRQIEACKQELAASTNAAVDGAMLAAIETHRQAVCRLQRECEMEDRKAVTGG